ncbi:hypothetical protein, partial [Rhodoferax sp.]|uniref:hypothetical protein n=1 Tax=Rhodoferax sp. TaxID=50421 RepID=UPI002766F18D|nr:hypothetical protein [Rhodoferax sp.]
MKDRERWRLEIHKAYGSVIAMTTDIRHCERSAAIVTYRRDGSPRYARDDELVGSGLAMTTDIRHCERSAAIVTYRRDGSPRYARDDELGGLRPGDDGSASSSEVSPRIHESCPRATALGTQA